MLPAEAHCQRKQRYPQRLTAAAIAVDANMYATGRKEDALEWERERKQKWDP